MAGFVVLAGARPLWAQATGSMSGLVTDASGAALPGVTIEAINEATGVSRRAVSEGQGLYAIALLPPGTYRVKASLAGFRTLVREGVVVQVNQTARVNLPLEVGSVAESVTIRADAPLVETGHATLGIVIDERKIVDLPLNGRNFAQLGTLIPGVVAPPLSLGGLEGDATPGGAGGFVNTTGSYNVNGMRNQSNNFLLDGSSNNDTFNTGFVMRPPPDAIEEFKILTHSYNAEYGRNMGAVISVVTKSGTNDWHGGAWEFNRSDALQARNFFAAPNQPKPALKQNQFGGSLGGPIRKNKLLAFGYYEGYRNTQGTLNTSVVLSEAQRRGDFGGEAAIRDPVTGQPFPGNVIPAGRLDPVAQAVLREFVPLPNAANNRYSMAPEITDDRDQFGIRLDYHPSTKHSILGRYMRSQRERTDAFGTSQLVASIFPPVARKDTHTLQDVMASDTFVLRANVVNVARVSFNQIDASPNTLSGRAPSELGWNIATNSNPRSVGLPWTTVTGFFTTGDGAFAFVSRKNKVLQLADDLSWVSGRHSARFGVDIRREEMAFENVNRPNGDFTFNGTFTGNAAADFLLGLPVTFSQGVGNFARTGVGWSYALYGQDEFRLSPRLTFNYGLRYELAMPFVEAEDRLRAFHVGQQSQRFPAAPTGLVYPGDPGVPRGTYEADKNNLAPRLGLVWDPAGKGRTVVRAGWGIFYDAVLAGIGDFLQQAGSTPPFAALTTTAFSLTSLGSYQDPLRGRTFSAATFPPGLTFIGWSLESPFKTPWAHHWNLTVQQQIGDSLGVELGYVGSRAHNLPLYLEANPGVVVPGQTVRGARVFPAFGGVRPTFSVGRSWYDALQVAARLRPTRGLSALAAYTWSHAIDFHNSGLNIGDFTMPRLAVDLTNLGTIDEVLASVRGNAQFDVRHRFVLSLGLELPRFDEKGRLFKTVLGGWQVNAIVQAQSGSPVWVVEPVDVALRFTANAPNQVCDPNADAPHTVQKWFRTECFQRLVLPQDAGKIGDAGRNTVQGPGFSQTDLSLFKTIHLKADHMLQLRLEAFNVFNQVRFALPGNMMGSPLFGVITAAGDARTLQLGAKYSF
jgi:hypothetical protein